MPKAFGQSKQISMKKGSTVPNEGGSGKMLKGQKTGTQTPGRSSQEKKGSSGKGAAGGSTKMFGKSGSNQQKPGRTSVR